MTAEVDRLLAAVDELRARQDALELVFTELGPYIGSRQLLAAEAAFKRQIAEAPDAYTRERYEQALAHVENARKRRVLFRHGIGLG